MIVLRLIHIVAGVFWVGATMFTAAFLLPSVRAIGPAAGPLMQQLAQVRKLPVYMMTATVLTVLSGFAMYWRASGGFSNGWMHSGQGVTFGIGGALALIVAVVGMAIISPSAKRAGMLAASISAGGRPPTAEQQAEMQRLQARIGKVSALAASLLVLATAAMAVARYVA